MKKYCRHLISIFIIFIIFIVLPISAYADVGGICAEGIDHFDHNFSLNGNGADDIVAVAVAQMGRNGESFGYHTDWGGWCAAFVNDCAYLAGQASAVPFVTKQTHDPGLLRKQILNNGGTEVSSPQKGDIVFYNNGSRYSHVGIMTDSSHTVEGNVDNMVKAVTPWGRGYSSISFIRPAYKANSFYLDVNGVLNGVDSGGIGDFGTFDVYINGSRVADDVNDYYTKWTIGTLYEITDIKPSAEHTYSGNASYSGRIGSTDVTVKLPFDTYGTLTVKGKLDGTVASDLSGFGAFDVYINGKIDGTGLTSYSKKWPKGTTYDVKNVNALGDHLYDETAAGNTAGTLSYSSMAVTLSFTSRGTATENWTYTDVLPLNITSDYCDIEYKYTYETTAQASPGEGWTMVAGSGVTTYQNSGGIVENYIPQATSDTFVLVGSYYYHYCDPTSGRVNYKYASPYTNLHGPNDINAFNVVSEIGDDDDSAIRVYKLQWKSGYEYTGDATCPLGASAWWYKMYQYQPRVAVTAYTWKKESDWQKTEDSSASSATYRYRLKDRTAPVINSVNVTEITPSDYTITCSAADDVSLSKIVVSSWTDAETEADAVVNSFMIEDAGKQVKQDITISISDHRNLKDTNYNTKITVYDKAGNSTVYTETVRVYIPALARSARKLRLPSDLTEIGEEAFEGSISFGEAELPETVEKIGDRAFADCSRLVLISIPDSVTEIGENVFDGSIHVVILCSIDSDAAEYAREYNIPYITALSAGN